MKSITRITRLTALLVALLTSYSHAAASTTLPLNTGYNYVPTIPYAAGLQDLYWINIASYPSGSSAVGPSKVVAPVSGQWVAPFLGSMWITGFPTAASPAGTSENNPAYTIFRKCFCLLPDFKDVKLSFQARADNSLQVWLNTQLNQLLPPSKGNFGISLPWSGPPLIGGTTKGFRVGPNCLYALVEDTGVSMGFNLEGTISAAYGLLPTPAVGVAQSYAPCSCDTRIPRPTDAASPRDPAALERRAQGADDTDDREVVQAIIKIAEARRLERQRGRQ